MSKHTRGSWTYNAKAREVLAPSEQSSGGEPMYHRTIAEVKRTGWAPQHEAEVEANGRLISAAPELAAALDDFGTWAINMHDFGTLDPASRAELKQLIESAGAALGKARGGS